MIVNLYLPLSLSVFLALAGPGDKKLQIDDCPCVTGFDLLRPDMLLFADRKRSIFSSVKIRKSIFRNREKTRTIYFSNRTMH